MNLKKFLLGFFGVLILGVGVAIGVSLVGQNQDVREIAAPATVAFISPSPQEVNKGQNFSFSVKMDSGTNQITGADIKLSFDKNVFEIVSLETGSGAGNLTNTIDSSFDNNTGTISYVIFTLDKTKAITGSGLEILKVNAKVKANATSGSYSIAFNSQTAASGTLETQNILTSLTPSVVNVSSTQTTNTPTSSPYVEGEPNSCGGTCGSNYNCAMNYFCYDGFCRSPLCPSDKTCGCITPKPTLKASPKVTKTPEVVYYPGSQRTMSSKPTPTIGSFGTNAPLENMPTAKKIDWVFIGILSAVALSVLFTIWAFIRASKKPDIPQIT